MIMFDFMCNRCDHKFEELVDSRKVTTTVCPECRGTAERTISAVKTGLYTLRDAAGRAEVLRRRSHEDTVKQVKKEPEKYGLTGKRK